MKIAFILLLLVLGCGSDTSVDNDVNSPTYGQHRRHRRGWRFPWFRSHRRNRGGHFGHHGGRGGGHLLDKCAVLEGQERLSCQDAHEQIKGD